MGTNALKITLLANGWGTRQKKAGTKGKNDCRDNQAGEPRLKVKNDTDPP